MTKAIILDQLTVRGGAERVALKISEALKIDEIICGTYDPKNTDPEFQKYKIRDLNCWNNNAKGTFGLAKKIIKIIWGFKTLKHNHDEIIVIGMWGVYSPKKKHGKKIWYCLSPPREIYDLKHHYLGQQPFWARLPARLYSAVKEWMDQKNIRTFDKIISISKTVQKRVKKYYGKETQIIYPFVETKKFHNSPSKGYFLCVSRFNELKRTEIVVEAFKKIPDLTVKIVGGAIKDYGNLERCKELSGNAKNIEFITNISDRELTKLYAESEAVICPAMLEDFGIIPLEAKASGKPVIVCDDGEGLLETINKEDSIVLNKNYVENLIKTVKNWKKLNWNTKKIMKRAEYYDVSRFEKEFRQVLIGDIK